MSRAPLVMGKAETAFQRSADVHDTTIGWRFINPLIKAQYGVDSMPETAENVAEQFQITRARPGCLRFPQPAARGEPRSARGFFAEEIVPIEAKDARGKPATVSADEHPRPSTTLDDLAKLKTPFRNPGTVTAGNASGVNDGAAAIILASEQAAKAHGPDAACARAGHGDGRRGAAGDGRGAGAGDREAPRPPRHEARCFRRH